MSNKKCNYMPYLMWLFPLLFFGYQFILRLWPGLMMDPIMKQFAIDATSFGLLASAYYWGYALTQIPIAILLDKYGPKYILFICAIICGFAAILFSYTQSWPLALLARFLVGVGSAAGILTVSKVISQWFPKDKYSHMIGLSFFFGLMGAVYGGRPIHNLVENLGMWQVAIVLGAFSIAIGLLALLFLKTKGPEQTKSLEQPIELNDLLQILSSPAVWILAIANLLMVGSLEGFADVWGVNYLMTAYELKKSDAAELTSYIFVGMIFGGPILAIIGSYFGNYRTIAVCGFGMILAFCFIVYSHFEYHYYLFAAIFLFIGILCCYQVLVFSVGNDLVDMKLLGVTIAFLNCMNMFGGSFFHTVIGKLMDVFWSGQFTDEGVRIYTIESYNIALTVIPVCAVIGALMVLYVGAKYKAKR